MVTLRAADALEEAPEALRPERAGTRKRYPPDWLSVDGKRLYRRLARELEANAGDAFATTDLPSVALAAELYAMAISAAKAMRADGNTIDLLDPDRVHGGQLKKRAAFSAFVQATNAYNAIARELGLTLASRERLNLDAGGDVLLPDDEEDLEDLLG